MEGEECIINAKYPNIPIFAENTAPCLTDGCMLHVVFHINNMEYNMQNNWARETIWPARSSIQGSCINIVHY